MGDKEVKVDCLMYKVYYIAALLIQPGMNKPQAVDGLIPVRDFAKTYISRRGYPVTVQYIYKLIKENKETGRDIPFTYKEIDKAIWIVK
jgi:hypothetical protein